MLIPIKITTKTPNIRDFRNNYSKFERFHAEYTENSGYSMRFFRKIGKIAVISIILIKKPNNWVENSEKSDFSLELVGIFAIISTNNYMWIHISKIAKTAIFSTQTKVETIHKLILQKPSTIIVENTENPPNSSSYTIEHKVVRNSHLLFHKAGIFSKCHINCSIYKA